MDTKISAWTANSSHFESLIELGHSYYPVNHPVLTNEFLKWFYIDNPEGNATLIVAHEENLWMGIIVLIPVMLECPSGQLQKACYAVNVLTHPDHRTKNLFVKMIRHTRDILSNNNIWLLGHPNTNAIPGWRRQKMEFRDPLHLYLAKFNLPFSSIYTNRIVSLDQLLKIPLSFWSVLTDRHDVHIRYTPEFIAWRFLDAPHRKYVVSTVYKSEEFLGLHVTRRFKGPIDLMVDFITPSRMAGDVCSSVWRPTLVMHSNTGTAGTEIRKGCWKLPVKRQFPFFVTTWEQEDVFDMSGITLAASDF